jgi:hypothetical protein
VAVGWQIYEITRWPLDLGLVGRRKFFELFLFLLGGYVAEHVLIACYASSVLCSLARLIITVRYWRASNTSIAMNEAHGIVHESLRTT